MPESKKLIYLSDQDDRCREETAGLLAMQGYDVATFDSAEETLEKAAATPPSLFITSMGLGGKMDGLGFIRALKADERLKAIPIIFHTGARRVMHMPYVFAPDPVHFPVFAVIEKPVRPAYLYEVVEKALA